MNQSNLSKLQIRAEVLQVLQILNSSDLTEEAFNKQLNSINTIGDKNFVIEFLLKELLKSDEKRAKIISFFITSLGSFELIKDTLWEYINNPRVSDIVKETSARILSKFGDNVSVEKLVTFLDNPDEVVDRETKKLLEVATVNPEAQIDFLDFLFALNPAERFQLIDSLKQDYPGDYLVNILFPAYYYSSDSEFKKSIINIMGESKSSLAVPFLNDILANTKDLQEQSIIKLNLKKLKLAGIDVNISEYGQFYSQIFENSAPFECYIGLADGVGNQGIIFSRKQHNNMLSMFSVVINDIEGIVDCFGFSNLTSADFSKIVDRYSQQAFIVNVQPAFIKQQLLTAEKTSFEKGNEIPYEYTAWKIYAFDVESEFEVTKSYEKYTKPDILNKFFCFEESACWFFEQKDFSEIENLFNEIDNYVSSQQIIDEIFCGFLDEITKKYCNIIYNSKYREILINRLEKNAFLFSLSNQKELSNLNYTLAEFLNEQNDIAARFLTIILRKSIWHYFLTLLPSKEELSKTSVFNKPKNNSKFEETLLLKIINILDKWITS